jgi:putative FmdB family regulatory protein
MAHGVSTSTIQSTVGVWLEFGQKSLIEERAMPTYEYACERCQKTYDVVQKLSDPLLSRCPKCGSKKIRRCISLPTVVSQPKSGRVRRALPQGGQLVIDGSMRDDFRHPNPKFDGASGYAFGALDESRSRKRG